MTGDLSRAMIRSVQVGPAAPIRLNDVPSGFRRSAATGRVAVGRLGPEVDAQVDVAAQ